MGGCVGGNEHAHKLEQVQSLDVSDDVKYADNRSPHQDIDKHMHDQKKKDKQLIKLLLLGSGSSGKSTLFRQIEDIHGDDALRGSMYTGDNRWFVSEEAIRRTIRYNCMTQLVKLLEKSEYLVTKFNFAECKVDITDTKIMEAESDLEDADEYRRLGETMAFLWKLDGIKETFKRRHFFSLMENIDFFLNKVETVMDDSKENRFEPTKQDIINARILTTGIVEKDYMINDINFKIMDVGGQRNERRKWIHLFNKVNGLIFVAALNHYCCVLFEDETLNAMKESLQLFAEITNAKWFSSRHTQFILFLNKNDLFVQRLRVDRIPLTFCFEDEYKGKNYTDKEVPSSQEEDDQWFEECYAENIEFVKEQYLAQNRNIRVIFDTPYP